MFSRTGMYTQRWSNGTRRSLLPQIMQRESQWTRKLLTTNRGLKCYR